MDYEFNLCFEDFLCAFVILIYCIMNIQTHHQCWSIY